MRRAWIGLAFALAAVAARLDAQPPTTSPPTAPPMYLPYRYDEDWSAMRDPARRTEWWDEIKYIPLRESADGSNADWYLSLGGEARWRYEQFQHPAFGAQPQDDSGYALQRYLLHGDWRFGPRVRVFTELQSGLEAGRRGGPRPTDEDQLDVHEAFVDVRWGSRERGTFTVRGGRQEVAFGAGRLMSAAEGLNVRRSFDGLRLIATRGRWTFNSTALRLVAAQRGLFDDKNEAGQSYLGAGATGPHPFLRNGNTSLAAYYFRFRRDDARVDEGVVDSRRHVIGTRTWGRVGSFEHDEEVIVQWGRQSGSSGRGAVRAWALAFEEGYTFERVSRHPRVGVRTFVASGDRHRGDGRLGSFDPLFPGTAYSGRAGLIGPTNLITLDPNLRVLLTPRVTLTTDWAWFWRTRIEDGVYGINASLLRTGRLSAARFVGSQATLELDWRVGRHLSVSGSIVGFQTGRFLEETPPGDDIRYVAIQTAYRF